MWIFSIFLHFLPLLCFKEAMSQDLPSSATDQTPVPSDTTNTTSPSASATTYPTILPPVTSDFNLFTSEPTIPSVPSTYPPGNPMNPASVSGYQVDPPPIEQPAPGPIYFPIFAPRRQRSPWESKPTIESSTAASEKLGWSDCGGVRDNEHREIRYKPATSVKANERCVWIIRYPNAKYYEITLKFGNRVSDDSKQRISISAYNPGSPPYHMYPEQERKEEELQTFTFRATMVVVTFYTGSNVLPGDRGFALGYGVYYETDSTDTQEKKGHLIPPDMLVKYPPNYYHTYANNDLALFVFLLRDDTFTQGLANMVTYKRMSLENNTCNDFIQVIKFDYDSDNKWIDEKTLCGYDPETSVDIVHNDLLLFMFQSDFSVSGKGFSLFSRVVDDEDDAPTCDFCD